MKLKLRFVILLACAISATVNAQILLDYDTVYSGINDDYEVVSHNEFTNILPQLKTYRWVRNEVVMPSPWYTLICDKNNCFSSSVDSMEVELGPNASSLLDVHLRVGGVVEGYAVVELLIKDVNNPVNSKTAVYVFDSGFALSSQEAQRLDFKLYPNPSSGLFTVANTEKKVDKLEIFSTTGQLMTRFDIAEGNWYDIADLHAGTYLARLVDAQGLTLGTKLITKI